MAIVLPQQFKDTVKGIKAKGRGGIEDEQRVIVRAEPGRLVLVGIGTEDKPGNEMVCPMNYDGPVVAVITSLVGLRLIAGVLRASDTVELEVCEKQGVSVSITSWREHGREATLRSRSTLSPRTVP